MYYFCKFALSLKLHQNKKFKIFKNYFRLHVPIIFLKTWGTIVLHWYHLSFIRSKELIVNYNFLLTYLLETQLVKDGMCWPKPVVSFSSGHRELLSSLQFCYRSSGQRNVTSNMLPCNSLNSLFCTCCPDTEDPVEDSRVLDGRWQECRSLHDYVWSEPLPGLNWIMARTGNKLHCVKLQRLVGYLW